MKECFLKISMHVHNIATYELKNLYWNRRKNMNRVS